MVSTTFAPAVAAAALALAALAATWVFAAAYAAEASGEARAGQGSTNSVDASQSDDTREARYDFNGLATQNTKPKGKSRGLGRQGIVLTTSEMAEEETTQQRGCFCRPRVGWKKPARRWRRPLPKRERTSQTTKTIKSARNHNKTTCDAALGTKRRSTRRGESNRTKAVAHQTTNRTLMAHAIVLRTRHLDVKRDHPPSSE